MRVKAEKTKVVAFRVPESVSDAFFELAEVEDRTAADTVRLILVDFVVRHTSKHADRGINSFNLASMLLEAKKSGLLEEMADTLETLPKTDAEYAAEIGHLVEEMRAAIEKVEQYAEIGGKLTYSEERERVEA